MIPVIFINCKKHPFIQQIINGDKIYETRNRNTLGRFIGEQVLLAETGNAKPVVKCIATIATVIEVFTANAYRAHITPRDVPPGSEYDWQQDTQRKVLYKLEDVHPLQPFTPTGKRHGYVWMECNNLGVF